MEVAFEKLMFAAEPILKQPDPTTPFVIQADATDVAVGAVLLQKNDQGVLQPCAYTSKNCGDRQYGGKKHMQCIGHSSLGVIS